MGSIGNISLVNNVDKGVFPSDNMTRKWGKNKEYWPSISARISPQDKNKLLSKHPADGEVSKVIRALITRYLEGRIIGLKIDTTSST